ncbi:MAG: AAA family ATPase [Bryobacteraceae bacterium]
MLGDKRLIRTIRLTNLLSFGPKTEETELLGLNVLIGPNGSGKSNLIEAVDLLRACPTDVQAPIRAGGGISEWLWKGSRGAPASVGAPHAVIDVTVGYPTGPMPLRHRLSFTRAAVRFELVDEMIEDEGADPGQPHYRNERGQAFARVAISETESREIRRSQVGPDQSVLSQLRAAGVYPEITYLGKEYDAIRLYRGWYTGEQSVLRQPQRTDLPPDFLLEDASNLCLVLDNLELLGMQNVLVDRLREFHEPIASLHTIASGGSIQLFLDERTLADRIPAARLSDGTLRYLCLLTILCHPSPPPLICIEEPEIGLHPDILPTIAELLVEASQRTQLIVTTHSEALVDALTDTPEAVVVCEKEAGSTTMRRLDKGALKEWLDKYSLGHLWRTGELGGNRW